MTSAADDRRELDALAALIAQCRDGARLLKRDMLTYQLDMAFIAARSDVDGPEDAERTRSVQQMFAISAHQGGGGPPARLELGTIAKMVEGCRDRAEDLGRSTLVYMLNMALLEIEGSPQRRD